MITTTNPLHLLLGLLFVLSLSDMGFAQARPSAQSQPVSPATADIRTRFPKAPRVVAIGDVHGDLDALKKALRIAGAIDSKDKWVGKKMVLVQTGDQLDRGDTEIEILVLLERLQKEAEADGGQIHVLNGNHEFMNAYGDMRYVTPLGILQFTQRAALPGNPDRIDLQRPGLEAFSPAHRARIAAWAAGGPYAKRIGTRNTVVVVGDTVFVHGGITPRWARYGLEKINQETREWLTGTWHGTSSNSIPLPSAKVAPPPESILSPDGPVWSREFSQEPAKINCDQLQQSLNILNVKRMVVGHTVQKTGIQNACGGRVWMIDVGMAAHYGGTVQVLELSSTGVRVLKSSP